MLYELVLIITLIVLVIWVIRHERLSKINKALIACTLLLLLGAGIAYEMNRSQQNRDDRAKINAFKQGKTLQCQPVDVNLKSFVFVNGTLSFLPADTNEKDKGIVVDLSTCKIKN